VTDGLRRLLTEPEWAARLGRAGLNRVGKDFSWCASRKRPARLLAESEADLGRLPARTLAPAANEAIFVTEKHFNLLVS
jgi:hypothetical protein